MQAQPVGALVEQLARFPGVNGCALVDADTGMVWFHAGQQAMDQVGEAAIEFWRIEMRLARHFSAMGRLQSAAYSFANNVIALFPCAQKPPLVLVCVAAKQGMAWPDWGRRVAELQQVLASGSAAQPPPPD